MNIELKPCAPDEALLEWAKRWCTILGIDYGDDPCYAKILFACFKRIAKEE